MWLAVIVSAKNKQNKTKQKKIKITEWPQMIIHVLRLCPLLVDRVSIKTRSQAVGFNSSIHGLFDHTGSSID